MKIAAAKDMKVIKENMVSYVDDHGDLREATEHVYKIEVALTMSDGSEHKAHVYTIKFSDPGAASAFNQFPVDSIENLNKALERIPSMRDFNVDEDADFLDEVARKLVRAYATKNGTSYSWSQTPRGVAYDLGLLDD